MPNSKTISLDIGGTRIKMAIVENGIVIKTATIPARSESKLYDRLAAIEAALRELADDDFSTFIGVGIAMPCLVDSKRKVATEIYKKFEDATSLDLQAWIKECFDLPIIMEQDSKAALLGEVHCGVAKGYQDVLLIIMGTGVGTAVMLDGKLLDSRNHSAGALGSHIIIEKNGRKCSCNSRGCLEAYTSGWALPGLLKDHADFESSILSKIEVLDFLQLKNAVKQNDPVAMDVMDTVIKSMRVGIISMIHAYDPAAVILSGGPLNMGALFSQPLLNGIQEEIWGKGRSVEFMIAQHPDESVVLGLHYLMTREMGMNGQTVKYA